MSYYNNDRPDIRATLVHERKKETPKRIQANRKSKTIMKRSNPRIRDLRLVYRM